MKEKKNQDMVGITNLKCQRKWGSEFELLALIQPTEGDKAKSQTQVFLLQVNAFFLNWLRNLFAKSWIFKSDDTLGALN